MKWFRILPRRRSGPGLQDLPGRCRLDGPGARHLSWRTSFPALEQTRADLQQPLGLPGAAAGQNLQGLAVETGVMNEERLDLIEQARPEVGESPHMPVVRRVRRDREEAVVPLPRSAS